MTKPRFKIDVYDYRSRPFGLYFNKGGGFFHEWKLIDFFETKEEARAFYDLVKDLPEYLP